VNATYSNTNSILEIFHLPTIELKHEYSEMLLLYVPSLQNAAITIMDGPFLSITPYGKSGLHVLSSVIYTHHASTRSGGRSLPCQPGNTNCNVDSFALCQKCAVKPHSARAYLANQLENFLPNLGPIYQHGSIETIKSTWATDDYRDERQTSVRQLSSSPNFFTVLSGKVSNIYEVEEIANV
jgi:hypothetical protein